MIEEKNLKNKKVSDTSNTGEREMTQPVDRGAAHFPVAGIGASAGGIEALRVFLEKLPIETGIAYVIVQHLSPNHKSILPELLERKTSMPVHKVEDGMAVEKNNVYVIPSNTYMSIVDGHLTLTPRESISGLFLPIDFFFKNLAHIYQNKAIGILLSGTGSDGTEGFRDIKGEGGITFTQDSSAGFKEMAQSAVNAGLVDFILPLEQIAIELDEILKQPYISLPSTDLQPENEAEFKKIISILNNKKEIDFSLYKQTTINRRILRRMALNRKKNLKEYGKLLREDDKEVSQLYQDLLINVTSFFRDASVYHTLKKNILPELFKKRKIADTLRVWITACASGEEAISFAITIYEYLRTNGLTIPFQIFATDLNAIAIDKARTGNFSINSVANVSRERLEKFFQKKDGYYQVIKPIRDACIFAAHNLLTDPPFSKMDIVSCQNVMIYFDTPAQKKILKAFNYALKPNGFLILGKSESLGTSTDLFTQSDKDRKIFNRKHVLVLPDYDFTFPAVPVFPKDKQSEKPGVDGIKETDIEKEIDKLLLSRYTPASVVVNNDLQILRFHGPTSRYLQQPFGKASFNLLKMVRDDLVVDLRTLIQKAKTEGITVTKDGVRLIQNDILEEVNLEVVPIRQYQKNPYFLILFKEVQKNGFIPPDTTKNKTKNKDTKDHEIEVLKQNVSEARESIRSISEEFEATREELQSSNEEVLSSNEELQSMNEELETSKEELQSANEELITINDELNQKNSELREAFDYRQAIVETIREPLLVLDTQLRVLSANRAFYENFLQRQSETEGFYIDEMGKGQWDIPELKEHLSQIIYKEKKFENFEVDHVFSSLGERVFLFSAMRMAIEEKNNNRILLVIEDITTRRRAEENLKQNLKTNTSILNSISDIFISVDTNWRFTFINHPAEEFIGEKGGELIGTNLWEIFSRYMDTVFHKSLISAMRTKTATQFEFYDERRDEWYHFRLYPSQDTLSIYGDRITRQKAVEQSLVKTKKQLDFALTAGSVGTFTWDLKSKKITWSNVQESLYGLPGNSFKGGFDDWFQFIHEDDKEPITKALNSSLENQKELITEFRITWADGSLHWILCRANIFYNRKGTATEMSGINIDISERKFKEKMMVENEERFRALVQNSFDVITVFNYDGTITYQSDSILRVLGYTAEERIGKNLFEESVVHPDDREKERSLFQRCIEDPYVFFREEFRMKHKEGGYRVMEVGCINLANNSSLKGIIKNYRDITERKQIEKQKEEFIGIASHELKTPVTSIKGYAQILQEILKEKKDFDSAGLLQKMDGQIDRLTNLIKDLLDVTKITEGKLNMKNAPYDINNLIKDVVEEMQRTSKKHEIQMNLQPLHPIIGDKEKISQVLVNLFSNAIKYSPDSSEIVVSTTADADKITVCVQDFGIGIATEMQKNLFQKFFRVLDETTATFPGLGLGLFISSEIVTRHDGRIWVESTPGKGSSFLFSLPYA